MVKRTFLDKSTTIVNNSGLNYGLNPICMLNYGISLSRFLVHFNTDSLKELVSGGTIFNREQVKHTLKMKNCGSLDKYAFADKIASDDINGIKERSVSFTVMAFKIPQEWDEGVGFDNESDFWIQGKGIQSNDGATWEKATNFTIWEDEGIYSLDKLYEEYEKFKIGETSVIISEQHFDRGNEDIEIDITKYVNDIIFDNTPNYGLCLAFIPELESTVRETTQYVGFFNEKTNTIYEPIVETKLLNTIHDDRFNFVLNKKNNLFLYCYINGELKNLDYIPTCTIETPCQEDIVPTVIHKSKGVYCVELILPSSSYTKDIVLHDVWGNLFYDGNKLDDVDNSFATKGQETYFSITSKQEIPQTLNPIVNGINDNEELNRGEVRTVNIYFKIPYQNTEYQLVSECWYRIYVKNGDKEITVIDWDDINIMSESNLFEIDTNGLVPCEYQVDIKAKFGNNIRIFKNQLKFKIKSDMKYQKY